MKYTVYRTRARLSLSQVIASLKYKPRNIEEMPPNFKEKKPMENDEEVISGHMIYGPVAFVRNKVSHVDRSRNGASWWPATFKLVLLNCKIFPPVNSTGISCDNI